MLQNWNNNYNKICWILIAELRTILHKACVCVCVCEHTAIALFHCVNLFNMFHMHSTWHNTQTAATVNELSKQLCNAYLCVCMWSGSRHFRTPNWSMVLVFFETQISCRLLWLICMKKLRIIAGITVFIPCNKVMQKGCHLCLCILFYSTCYELAKCLQPVCGWYVS